MRSKLDYRALTGEAYVHGHGAYAIKSQHYLFSKIKKYLQLVVTKQKIYSEQCCSMHGLPFTFSAILNYVSHFSFQLQIKISRTHHNKLLLILVK